MKQVCILGGTGFVGQHLAAQLAKQGVKIRIVSRHPQRHRELSVLPGVEVVKANIYQQAELNAQLVGCEAVINLVGILNENNKNNQQFREVHVDLPNKIITACAAQNVNRLLHLSALQADPKQGKSQYLRSKGEGEYAVQMAANLQATVFRPSVIFGAGDSFFNRFAEFLRLIPCCFPLACPNAKLTPVWVNDVTAAIIYSLENPKLTAGHAYDLCGPQVYTLRQLVSYTARVIGVKRRIIPLNDSLSRLQAAVMNFVPGKPFSTDNYLSLQTDGVCRENHLKTLGIEPHSIESIAPTYLAARTSRGRYDQFRYAARRS